MARKTNHPLLPIIACLLVGAAYGQQKIPVTEGAIRRLAPFGAPDTIAGTYFYGLSGIACTEDGKLFLSDQQAGCVRIFSLESQKELFRFGRIGGGPGEFKRFGRLKLLRGRRIIAVDNDLLRASVFSEDGKLLRTISLKSITDDVDFIGEDSLVVCSFRFESNFKPLRIVGISSGTVLTEFGEIIETQKGIIKIIDAIAPENREFYRGWIGNVLVLSDQRHILYSQRHPYVLVRYDLKTRVAQRFEVPLEISVEDQLLIERTEGGRRYSSKPSGQVLQPMACGSFIFVSIFSADAQTNCLDCYSQNGEFKKRFKIPALAKNVVPMWSALRGDKELLLLMRDYLRINWVERFSLTFMK